MSKRTRGLRILALCASLVVALVGFAMPAHAATGNVAKIGGTEYRTIGEAVNAAKDGETVTLIDNAKVESTVVVRGQSADARPERQDHWEHHRDMGGFILVDHFRS